MGRYTRASKRDQQLANNASHAYYAALTDKPPMLTVDVKPKRERGATAKDAPPKEHAEQVAVVKWWFLYSRTRGLDYRQLVAIPNAQALLKFATNPNAFMWHMRAEGLRPGVHDLVLFHAAQGQHGLLIEMKRLAGGVISPDQIEMDGVMNRAGYKVALCRGADSAIEVIKHYCEG